jgi:hypothetical protein
MAVSTYLAFYSGPSPAPLTGFSHPSSHQCALCDRNMVYDGHHYSLKPRYAGGYPDSIWLCHECHNDNERCGGIEEYESDPLPDLEDIPPALPAAEDEEEDEE